MSLPDPLQPGTEPLRTVEQPAGEVISPTGLRVEAPLPEERPAVAQGSIAGVPSKLWLRTTGGALLVTQAAYADELAGRLR